MSGRSLGLGQQPGRTRAKGSPHAGDPFRIASPPLPDFTRAACTGTPLDWWFPSPFDHHAIDRAKAICDTCPIQRSCLAVGLTELYGIWAGLTEAERATLRRRQRPPRRRPINHGTGTKGGAP